MDRDTVESHRAEVLERAASLERQFTSLAEEQALTSHDDEHDPEGVTIAVAREQIRGLLDAARAEIVALDNALARLDDGTYGTCLTCGGPIAAERLEALPAATTCIRCTGRRPRK